MWTRKELKQYARQRLFGNYSKCLGVSLILFALHMVSVIVVILSVSLPVGAIVTNMYRPYTEILDVITKFLLYSAMASVFTTLWNVLILQPMDVCSCHFFACNARTEAGVSELIHPVKETGYWKLVATRILKEALIFLWSLLFVVPGIIKRYECRMVPYLLTDYPEMNIGEVFQMSKRMMEGQKWNAFLLDLSFIGWYLLSGIIGLVRICYVDPYVRATDAELYLSLNNPRR